MGTPFFSIVIPTRNRAQTLLYSIKTILHQTHHDFEIIVSDNSTDSEAKILMDTITDPRIKYFRTNGDLSMVDNWEAALTRVTGKYVIYIGDDDGLLMDALSEVYKLIMEQSPDAVFFNWIDYNWPHQIDPRLIGNRISIPIIKEEHGFINSKQTLNNVVNAYSTYYVLPSIYYSFISKLVIDSIKDIDGRFFHSYNPDIFSGAILCLCSNKVYKTSKVLGIRGTSCKANGAAFLYKNEENKELQEDFIRLNNLSKIKWNENVPHIFNYYAIGLESYFQSCDLLNIKIPKHKLLIYYVKVIRRIYFDYNGDTEKVTEDLNITKEVIKRTKRLNFYEKFILSQYAINLLKNNAKRTFVSSEPSVETFGVGAKSIVVNGNSFSIENIVDVQNFMNTNKLI